jgi:hypothetical protein
LVTRAAVVALCGVCVCACMCVLWLFACWDMLACDRPHGAGHVPMHHPSRAENQPGLCPLVHSVVCVCLSLQCAALLVWLVLFSVLYQLSLRNGSRLQIGSTFRMQKAQLLLRLPLCMGMQALCQARFVCICCALRLAAAVEHGCVVALAMTVCLGSHLVWASTVHWGVAPVLEASRQPQQANSAAWGGQEFPAAGTPWSCVGVFDQQMGARCSHQLRMQQSCAAFLWLHWLAWRGFGTPVPGLRVDPPVRHVCRQCCGPWTMLVGRGCCFSHLLAGMTANGSQQLCGLDMCTLTVLQSAAACTCWGVWLFDSRSLSPFHWAQHHALSDPETQSNPRIWMV